MGVEKKTPQQKRRDINAFDKGHYRERFGCIKSEIIIAEDTDKERERGKIAHKKGKFG